MKKLLLAATAVVALTSAASAADMAVKARPAPVPVAIWNWTGFYIGASIGGDFVRSDVNGFLNPLSPGITPAQFADVNRQLSPRFEDTVVIATAQAGYNWQAGAWLFGVEGDISWRRARGLSVINPMIITGIPAPGNLSIQSFESNWLGTFRGRVGGVVNNTLLLYVTGGLAVADYRNTDTVGFAGPGTTQTAVISETRVGWAAGVGAEWMFAPNWSLKLEYLHADLGKIDSAVPSFAGFVNSDVQWSHRLTEDMGRVGVNYHFGGPVVARY
jgi:outer membrane immunogenic protein